MSTASIHPHPYKNAAGCRMMCNKTAPWEIGAKGAPGHLALSVCDQHAREIVGSIPDAFAAELGALVVEKIRAGGEAARILLDHIKAVRGEAPPGLPAVAAVVAEVQNGTDWGNALIEALLPVLAPDVDESEKEPPSQLVVEGEGGIEPQPAPRVEALLAPVAKTGEEDGKVYTLQEDGSVTCACGKVCEGPNGLTNWRKHKPHCKGPKEADHQ